MTQYVVLRQREIVIPVPDLDEPEIVRALTVVGTFEASSDDGANRAAAKLIYRGEKDIGRVTLVATPARSFRPGEYVVEEEPNVSKAAEVSVAGLT